MLRKIYGLDWYGCTRPTIQGMRVKRLWEGEGTVWKRNATWSSLSPVFPTLGDFFRLTWMVVSTFIPASIRWYSVINVHRTWWTQLYQSQFLPKSSRFCPISILNDNKIYSNFKMSLYCRKRSLRSLYSSTSLSFCENWFSARSGCLFNEISG